MVEPIAIIGMGCRFPQADSPDAFWQLLDNGKNAIVEVPKTRWDVDAFYDPQPDAPGKMSSRWGGFLNRVDEFDAEFFGISPEEAEHTDPQQRLLLEVAWEALERAGIVPAQLSGSQTGVFIGLCTIDYHRLLYRDYARLGPHSSVGTTSCITANRLSYLLDLRGPSISIDAACASGLVSVHLACQSLRSQESDLCLAGGVNLILSPDSTISSSQTRLLSKQGQCQPFDANADGYVRGEGCGVVVLKRLSDAVRDNDRILGLIRGSAVNQDGLSNSMTAPNGLAQQALIRQALTNAGVQPAEISYVEAHAVGTAIGDAIELRALKTVLMEGRTSEQPCWIGSAKPNIGHLEAASGVAALIKVILSLQHDTIPPLPHLEQLNPYIDLANTPFAIPTERQSWLRGTASRLAGISTFGFGGTNAHLILEEAPLVSVQRSTESSNSRPNESLMLLGSKQSVTSPERPHHLITLSAKNETALRLIAQRYADHLAAHPDLSLADVCFTANAGRTHFEHRLCLVTDSIAHLRQQLQAVSQAASPADVTGCFQGRVKGRKRPKLVFVFPGEEEWETASCPGIQLYETNAVFRQAFDRCATLLQPFLDISLTQPFSPPTLFALEYALAMLWQSWGIRPGAVIGYGVGEYVAACVAGVFDLEDALLLLLERFRHQRTFDLCISSNSADIATDVTYARPRIPVLAHDTGEPIAEEIATHAYWCAQRCPAGSPTVRSQSGQIDLTIGIDPAVADENYRLCSLRFGTEDWQTMLQCLGGLYSRGIAIDWVAFEQGYARQRLALPTYPFQRQRYWFPTTEPDEMSRPEPEAQRVDLLHRVEPQHVLWLKEQGNFSDTQIQLLPELLKVLAQN